MQKNIKRLRHSGIKLASAPSHKVYLSHTWWLSLAIHNFCIFVGYAWRFGFVQFNDWQFIPRYFLRYLTPGVSVLPTKCTNFRLKWKCRYILHAIIGIYFGCILYTNYIHSSHDMYNFCESELTHAKCTQDIYKIYHTFRQTLVYILYTKYIQKFVKMWDIFCI